MAALIEVKGLTKKYRVGQEIITALDHVDLAIEEGELLCILGASGSGKSTLLHVMSGLERPTRGEVWIKGVSLLKMKERKMAGFRRKYMGFIFQSYNLIPTLNALENVTLPLLFDGVSKKTREQRAYELLVQLGLKKRLKNKPTELSGGQQQRVSIARALVNNPEIIFADEPTGNLDSKTTEEIMTLLREKVKKFGVTLIMVTHDLEIAKFADRVVNMRDGKIIQISHHQHNQQVSLEGKFAADGSS